MSFTFYMPTKVIFKRGCILENTGLLRELGQKAVIVTGKRSGTASGALKDVITALDKEKIKYCLFDKIENNPTLLNVTEGKNFAVKEKADFVIGIGGGSPLDAAKAIAALCANQIEAIELFDGNIKNASLPIVAVPTTAGTGSEVTPYAVLTVREHHTKKSFSSPYSFPKIAFIDPSYTKSLQDVVTIDTAFDAFSHCLESYLSIKNTTHSSLYAKEGMIAFAKCLTAIERREFTAGIRDNLMYASYMGGLAITQTGTNFIHAMGYSLTYFKNISHGHANTMFIGEFLRYNYEIETKKINDILSILEWETIDSLESYLLENSGNKPVLTEEEIKEYATLACTQKNIANSPRPVDENEIKNIYRKVLRG